LHLGAARDTRQATCGWRDRPAACGPVQTRITQLVRKSVKSGYDLSLAVSSSAVLKAVAFMQI
jgi:hypothetical protein